MTLRITAGVGAILLSLAGTAPAHAQLQLKPEPARDFSPARSGTQTVAVELIADGFKQISSIAFLPDGRALVADRAAGTLSILDVRTKALTTIAGLPAIVTGEDAGIHDVLVHPQFASNSTIYLSYTFEHAGMYALVVDALKLRGTTVSEGRRIFTAQPFLESREHFGGKLAYDGRYLFITSGDRDHRHYAQRMDTHLGKTLRVSLDGGIPADNPFRDTASAVPEIWSYGHRNAQGMRIHPQIGELWQTEHGPRGGDEVNLIRRGANYGWPIVSYGFEYDGGSIGMGITHRPGMERPAHVYMPSMGRVIC